jgi:hypothetical protein
MTAGRTSIGKSRDWGTPKKYVGLVKDVLGEIQLDPCSNHLSIVGAINEWRLPDVDGLLGDWDFTSIFVNPPYGSDPARGTRIIHWLEKCCQANKEFDSEVMALIPVAPNTLHWKKYVWPSATAICFLYDTRLKFLVDGEEGGKGAPMACSMVYWGRNTDKFSSVFASAGKVIYLS